MQPTYAQLVQQLRRIGAAAACDLNQVASEISSGNDMLREIDRASKSIAREEVPIVVVEISGGAISVARSSAPMRVVILDADTEGGDERNIFAVNGIDFYVTDLSLGRGDDPNSDSVNPAYAQGIVEQIDKLTCERNAQTRAQHEGGLPS